MILSGFMNIDIYAEEIALCWRSCSFLATGNIHKKKLTETLPNPCQTRAETIPKLVLV